MMCMEYKTQIVKSNSRPRWSSQVFGDYSNVYILVKGTITITDASAKDTDKRYKKGAFKNCTLCTDCMSEMNNTHVDNAKDLDVLLLMHFLIDYSNIYVKTSKSIWQYHRS